MKKSVWLLLLLPLAAAAADPAPYAKRWLLVLSGEHAGAYRVVLDGEVYATTARADLRDIDVLDAHGKPVAAALFGPEQPTALPARRIVVPWFPLPAPAQAAGEPLRLSAQFGENGRIVRVQAEAAAPAVDGDGRAFLVDLSSIRDNTEAIEITWEPGTPREARYRVEASHDLQAWRTVDEAAALVELQRGGERLVRNEVPIPGGLRYVRFVPLDASPALPIREVRVRLDTAYMRQAMHWPALQGTRVQEQGRDYFVYQSDGRYPVSQVDLETGDYAVGEWTLESRDAPDAPWRHRAGPWVAYRVGGEKQSASPEQPLQGAPVRDRYWRLHARGAAPSQAPVLKLGYRPDVMVFLAQGEPPYALVAGSATAQRAQAPMPALVDALRADRGDGWQPSPAYLAKPEVLAGDAALVAPAPPRDWKSWLLWGLLVAGALLVAGFAFSLMRQPAKG